MAVTVADLRREFPEFTPAPDAVLEAAIAAGYVAHDAQVWGSHLDLGVMLYACDRLARSPYARDLRLQMQDGRSVYQTELERLRGQVGAAWRVLP